MIWWCIKNSVVLICFTVLVIVFEHWWIVLFGLLFMSNYKETPVNRKETTDGKTETQQKSN